MAHNCIKCNVPLIIGKNVTQHRIDNYQYICIKCNREYQRTRQNGYRYRVGRNQPMWKNRKCSVFLGVHVAEQVLSHVFNDVHRMPYGNSGFDFLCGKGHRIDVKSSCRHRYERCADSWMFGIKKNQIAQYFLCLAFNDRKDLTPEHIWLIPASKINHLVGTRISESNLCKWDEYRLDIDKVVSCCDTMKEQTK